MATKKDSKPNIAYVSKSDKDAEDQGAALEKDGYELYDTSGRSNRYRLTAKARKALGEADSSK